MWLLESVVRMKKIINRLLFVALFEGRTKFSGSHGLKIREQTREVPWAPQNITQLIEETETNIVFFYFGMVGKEIVLVHSRCFFHKSRNFFLLYLFRENIEYCLRCWGCIKKQTPLKHDFGHHLRLENSYIINMHGCVFLF